MPGILVEGLFVDVSEHELVAGIVVVPYPLIAFLIILYLEECSYLRVKLVSMATFAWL